MNFEDMQSTWQHAREAAAVPTDHRRLLHSVQAQSRTFARRIFWRDVREVLASGLVAGVFAKMAWEAEREGAGAWPAWLAALLPLLVAVFFLVDRWWSRRRSVPRGEPLRDELDRAIGAVSHQVWLLRNVLWWYMAPLGGSILLVALQITLHGPEMALWWFHGIVWVLMISIVVGVSGWVWRLNQTAVRTDLLPRLAELEARRRDLEA